MIVESRVEGDGSVMGGPQPQVRQLLSDGVEVKKWSSWPLKKPDIGTTTTAVFNGCLGQMIRLLGRSNGSVRGPCLGVLSQPVFP